MNTRFVVRLSFFVLPFSFFLAAGCSSHAPTLVVHSDSRKCSYAQSFSQAVAERTEDGTFQFVLVADDVRPPDQKHSKKDPAPSKRLDPSTATPLHQVVYLKVLWRPMGGTDRSIGSNSALDWYVLSDSAGGSRDLLEYTGSAFVTVNPKDDVTKVSIHGGTIKPRSVHGGLTDPIGPARIEGSFTAVNDPARLREVLNATRARTAAAVASGVR
jgi:hypothetical protein